MKCPIDSTELVISERTGVEIDFCPQCRGVWLDRGELDKIIDRADRSYGTSDDISYRGRDTRDYGRRDSHGSRGDHHGDKYDGHGDRRGRSRREGFLGNLFDF
ncbi:hypothetical protein GCM10010988_40740 [Cnuibacter physcomitrellae]|uniref:Uncharacterized protein n=1 Tax=Cnuibacter physcomitrellae TaxID=1619308 RepID=A0A1X9LR06_9MICO|nr:zf-TFIIB domain-containing protein [Cnuibacter physcomitrellae]ARJ07615.1 hypothetical protein B5808_19735 [Cnuibacter physcomitrellae]GGI42778.1 hypothetical protein GCM10010988_40740 [Cnuibacter physcomitrellae]